MSKIRLLIFLSTIVIVGFFGYIASLYARGYRFDTKSLNFVPNGLFVVNSNPNGAQVFVDGELKTATNATLSLGPGTYEVSLEKDGFLTWSKTLVVEKEVVTQIDVALFSAAPSLSALTFSGAFNPILSSSLTKIAYGVPFMESLTNGQARVSAGKEGLWVVETTNFPIGFNREARQITDGVLDGAAWEWSPNSQEILLTTAGGIFLLDTSEFTPQNELVNVTLQKEQILAEWQLERETRLDAQLTKLPEELENMLKEVATDILFSPDENKVLYTATASAVIPEGLTKPLPGSSTQKQERDIMPNKKYIYDIKEDRNFAVADASQATFWFPTSAHIIVPEEEKITIMDYDGTNRQTVYSGSYVSPFAYPYSNDSQLLILTNLGSNGAPPNLYTLSLK